jgi:hypothetical protein
MHLDRTKECGVEFHETSVNGKDYFSRGNRTALRNCGREIRSC